MTIANPPPTFGLTEEEQRLLRRTLRVIALEPGRLELAVKERTVSFVTVLLSLPLVFFLLFFLCAVLWAAASVQAEVLATLPFVLLSFLLNRAVAPRYEAEQVRSICLFAGTTWARGRRSRLPSYEVLIRVEPTKLVDQGETRFDTRIILTTSVRQMVLKRRRFDEASTTACRNLLTRLVQACSTQVEPSPAVESLAARDVVPIELPHPRYAAVVNENWLLSLTPNEMVMKSAGTATGEETVFSFIWILDAAAVLIGFLLYLDKQLEFRNLAALGCAMVLLRLPLLLVPRRRVELKRRERLVVLARRGARVEIPSQECDVDVDLRSAGGDCGDIWKLRLYRHHGGDGTSRSTSRVLGSWSLGFDLLEDEPRARNVALAVRYYLNHAEPDGGESRMKP
jgi:hypothetical protein